MELSSLLAVIAFFIRGAVCTCALTGLLAGRACKWEGTAPNCGEAEVSLDLGQDTDEGEQLVAWTRNYTWFQLFYITDEASWNRYQINVDMWPCAKHYGPGCLSGYKRLVCNGPKVCCHRHPAVINFLILKQDISRPCGCH